MFHGLTKNIGAGGPNFQSFCLEYEEGIDSHGGVYGVLVNNRTMPQGIRFRKVRRSARGFFHAYPALLEKQHALRVESPTNPVGAKIQTHACQIGRSSNSSRDSLRSAWPICGSPATYRGPTTARSFASTNPRPCAFYEIEADPTATGRLASWSGRLALRTACTEQGQAKD